MRAFPLSFVLLSSLALTACGSDDNSTSGTDDTGVVGDSAVLDTGARDTGARDSGVADSNKGETSGDSSTAETSADSTTSETSADSTSSETTADSTSTDTTTTDSATTTDSIVADVAIDGGGLEAGASCTSDPDCASPLKCCPGGAAGTHFCTLVLDGGT